MVALKTVNNIVKAFSEKVLSIEKQAQALGTDMNNALNNEQIDRKRKCDMIVAKFG